MIQLRKDFICLYFCFVRSESSSIFRYFRCFQSFQVKVQPGYNRRYSGADFRSICRILLLSRRRASNHTWGTNCCSGDPALGESPRSDLSQVYLLLNSILILTFKPHSHTGKGFELFDDIFRWTGRIVLNMDADSLWLSYLTNRRCCNTTSVSPVTSRRPVQGVDGDDLSDAFRERLKGSCRRWSRLFHVPPDLNSVGTFSFSSLLQNKTWSWRLKCAGTWTF